MRQKYLCIIALLVLFITFNCETPPNEEARKEQEQNINQGKTFERELLIDGHYSDTILTIKEFTSQIVNIENTLEWINTQSANSPSNTYKIHVICYKNSSTEIRTAHVIITCENGDKLNLKVKQNVLSDIDDIHNHQTDQPALAPLRY